MHCTVVFQIVVAFNRWTSRQCACTVDFLLRMHVPAYVPQHVYLFLSKATFAGFVGGEVEIEVEGVYGSLSGGAVVV